MENLQIISKKEAQYFYYEIPQGLALDKATLQQLRQMILKSKGSVKKWLIALPPNFNMDEPAYKAFLSFLRGTFPSQIMFVAQEGVKWGSGWDILVDTDFLVADKGKAIEWATKEPSPGAIQLLDFKTIRYLKWKGLASSALLQFAKTLEKALLGFELKVKPAAKPFSIALEKSTLWSSMANMLIFDISSLSLVDQKFFKTLNTILEKAKLKPNHTCLYFITSSCFQTWMATKVLGTIREAGNIIRVLSEKQPLSTDTIKIELESLYKQSQQFKPTPFILSHQVTGLQNALQLCAQFYPDLVIVDDISDSNALQSELGPGLKDKIHHITPASDPGVRLLSPELITKGYDIQLFGEYLLSRYRNGRGYPNDTYFYYLDAKPTHLKKVSNFFLMEFAEILPTTYQRTIQKVAECETKEDLQGSFAISLLQQKILKLDIRLPFTNQGGAQFLNNYEELFPEHCKVLCGPLRLLLRGDRDLPTEAVLHLTDEYNEFLIRQQGFEIEARFQAGKAGLTVKAAPDANLERRCFTLFALLNSSEVFAALPDKEVLIEIISLLWKNYSSKSKEGFLITLTTTDQSSRMKIYQSESNRVFLEASKHNDQIELAFLANISYHKDTARQLLKIVSLIFNENSPQSNQWRFGCFEALSQVTGNTITEQKLTLELGIKGKTTRLIVISSARDFNMIPGKSQKIMEAGSDRVYITPDSRQISMVKNPEADAPEIAQLSANIQQELENLQEKTILQEVEDEKAKEAQERSVRFQKVYDQALNVYNKRYGFEEGTGKAESSGVTLEQAVSTHVIQRRESQFGRRVRMTIYITLLAGLGVLALFYTVALKAKVKPQGEGLILQESTEASPTTTTGVEAGPDVTGPNSALGQAEFDPAKDLVLLICYELNNPVAPTQEQLNSMLKRLHFCAEQLKQSDVYHLIGRIYLYKIHLDREENLFSQQWVIRWKEEGKRAFLKAQELYQQKRLLRIFV